LDLLNPYLSDGSDTQGRPLHIECTPSQYHDCTVAKEIVAPLFQCASQTLLEFGTDLQRLGGEPGVTTVPQTSRTRKAQRRAPGEAQRRYTKAKRGLTQY